MIVQFLKLYLYVIYLQNCSSLQVKTTSDAHCLSSDIILVLNCSVYWIWEAFLSNFSLVVVYNFLSALLCCWLGDLKGIQPENVHYLSWGILFMVEKVGGLIHGKCPSKQCACVQLLHQSSERRLSSGNNWPVARQCVGQWADAATQCRRPTGRSSRRRWWTGACWEGRKSQDSNWRVQEDADYRARGMSRWLGSDRLWPGDWRSCTAGHGYHTAPLTESLLRCTVLPEKSVAFCLLSNFVLCYLYAKFFFQRMWLNYKELRRNQHCVYMCVCMWLCVLLCLCHLTVSAQALCSWAVHPPHLLVSFVCLLVLSDRSCYHDVPWTAWAISMKLTVNIQ